MWARAIAQRLGRRVDRVVAEDEDRARAARLSQNELGSASATNSTASLERLGKPQVAVPQFRRAPTDARGDGGPQDGVACRRLVTPALRRPFRRTASS